MKILKVSIIFLILSTLSGCSVSKGNADELNDSAEKNTSVSYDEEEKKQEERSKQTLWTVLDADGNDKEMLSEKNSEDVKEIMKLINEHCLLVDNRDFNELKVEDEYNLYNDTFIKVLDKGDHKKSVQAMYESNKLVLKHENLIWYRNYFNEDINTCKVTVESEFTIKDANKEYLNKNQMNLEEVYQEKRTYYLEKNNDEWKIINIEKGALTKRN
ncbi:MAG: hypothetical protein ACRCVJ_14465 [Clostridium sp.]|uniref:hypothetical protein n=1 Tax=Clostridium sp. TaxID=1506 RepID=UPI003F404481